MTLFRGCGVALVTPFDDTGVNERVLRELVEFQIDGGIDAIIVCGSTGEAATMSPDEQARTVEIAVSAVAGRVPVIAGAGGSNTAAVSELARAAAAAGANGLLASPPPYNKPSQHGMIAHFRAVIDAADLPAIIYNIPGRTACNILPVTLEELAADTRVVGIKEASGDISQVTEVCRRIGDRVAIYSGNDDQVIPVMSLGGWGVISVVANIAPRETVQVTRLVHTGDLEGARKLHFRFLPLIGTLFSEPNPIPVKAGVRALGFEAGEVRLPLTPLTEPTSEELLERMRDLGLLASVEV